MGSNQGKRPHASDRGGGKWSRDEKRESRRIHRREAVAKDIADSSESNEVKTQREIAFEHMMTDIEEFGIIPEPQVRRKKASRKWCRRKEGREHIFKHYKTWGLWGEKWGLPVLEEYICENCGYRKVKR